MYRLSLIISEVYNKYLPLAEKGHVALNLDFSDTTKTVDDPEAIKADLEKHLGSALDRSISGEVSIAVEQGAIVITDTGTTLSKPLCSLLSRGRVNVTSRVGFGTTVRISLLPPPDQPNETSASNTPVSVKPTAQAPTKTLATSKTVTATKATTSSAKSATKKAKLTREQRKLVAAAKKADRKIQKLRKSQQKSTKKSAAKKPVKTSSKTDQKSRKKVIELS